MSAPALTSSPFLFVADARLRPLPWALVTAPISTRDHHVELGELARAGYRFVGMPGYMTFPRPDGRDVRDYASLCEAWCHCFRDPDAYLPTGSPRALISHSDFTDPWHVRPDRLRSARCSDRTYDFAYVGAAEPWKQAAKSWALAAETVPALCEELGLVALVVGAPEGGFPHSPNVDAVAGLSSPELLARLASARFLFVPNVVDASPRTVTEALCLDVPVVVNRAILGGWKYVNPFTGVFFDGKDDVVAAVRACLARPRSPRRWYCANFGPYLAGARLLKLFRRLDRGISERSHLTVIDRADHAAVLAPRC
jgi:glycosyltransferase involved in cell wall biosynthesis